MPPALPGGHFPYAEITMSSDVVKDLQKYINAAQIPNKVKVLEAGCGSLSHININAETFIVGMDISDEQLEKNDDLDVKINADIQTYDFSENEYDVIVCWDVLEHLETPKQAIENFKRSAKNNSLIIIKVPNIQSLKGLVTKFTPHWFHVLFYKRILKKPNAGEPGYAPFPTYLKHEVSPSYLTSYALANNMNIEFMETYDALPRVLREEKKYLLHLYRILSSLLKVVTFGKYGGRDNTDFVMVLRKAE
jgi:SAM-dependent methyltransferase